MRRFSLLITLIISCLLLQSCFTAVGTAVVGGAVIYKRKALENTISDQHIDAKINNAYFQTGQLWEQNRIIVSCVNGNVLLTGEVRTAALKQQAIAIVKNIPEIKQVYDQIQIGKPVGLLQQTIDATITLIIKTKMLFAQNFDPSNIKVITNNNVVYLMGIVNPEQSDRAAEIASTSSGVKKVVKVFQYIT
jgi:osmotically-inducible protein OsmY